MNNIVVRVKNIHKVYKVGKIEVNALRGIDLEIKKGEFVAIMGPSGSGKSTLMNIIGCLDKPTNGEYWLEEHKIETMNDNQLAEIRNKKIGFVFQTFNLLPKATILHNVELPLIYAGVKKNIRKEKAQHLLEKIGLGKRLKHKPNELSGGERQRVAIARALINEPSLILADEPTGNLDSKTGGEIMEIFTNLNKSGKTIILVTHDNEIAKYAQRTIIIKDGKIINEYKR